DLADMLEASDPRAPIKREINGAQVTSIRQLIRINHHRNCLLCHPPGNTPDVVSEGAVLGSEIFVSQAVAALTAEVPAPGQKLPSHHSSYDSFAQFPDVLVRADITHLRQDFSLLQGVRGADPWPAMQRFDYLVQDRVLSTEEARAYEA